MSVYFNRTNGPLPLTLRDGSAVLIVPKGRLEVTEEQDSSSSIIRALQKGLIANVTPPAKVAAPEKAVKAEVKPVPKVEPKAESAPDHGFSFGNPGERKRDRR